MQLIELPAAWLVLTDIAAWAVLHLSVSLFLFFLPGHFFARTSFLTRIRGWEKGGETWQRLLRVKSWKDRLPDGNSVLGIGFQKKQLLSAHPDDLDEFVLESRRAEWTHWLLIPPSLLFFLWNPPWAGWMMIVYALAANLPFIFIQRYNRPRIERLITRKNNAAENLPVMCHVKAKRQGTL
ncbi:glycosyl-4,4'-diaponeurosporenoate acyltransferase [Bhargavaea ullalensis]|uniref:glycosyl-4,4'-diaponeurosporenoate acyltransferase CrtO family protein n=1 Tax=Bhargavaea ullalensis TaxID=1265685 RepID=UPI0033985559